ncbi:MAG: hypothetical protein AAGJ74_06040 [Pseudomonadota bacterium]
MTDHTQLTPEASSEPFFYRPEFWADVHRLAMERGLYEIAAEIRGLGVAGDLLAPVETGRLQ